MTNCEIARHLGKHSSWVCRTVQRLRAEQATAYATNPEQAAIAEANGQFERLIAAALAVRESAGATERGLAAIQAAADVLEKKLRFQLRTGQIQRRDGSHDTPAKLLKSPESPWADAPKEILDAALLAMAETVKAKGGGRSAQVISIFEHCGPHSTQ